jgi:hypothetical protein
MMAIYYLENDFGCTLIEASGIAKARQYVKNEYGNAGNPNGVRKASKSEKDWVTAMGGMTHKVTESVR